MTTPQAKHADPVLWKFIGRYQMGAPWGEFVDLLNSGRAVILTGHLCSKWGIQPWDLYSMDDYFACIDPYELVTMTIGWDEKSLTLVDPERVRVFLGDNPDWRPDAKIRELDATGKSF